jgi:hypothetical protein
MTDLQLTVGDIVTTNNNMSYELSDLKSKLHESMTECNALNESVNHLDYVCIYIILSILLFIFLINIVFFRKQKIIRKWYLNLDTI